jgi:GT2 family glycosyltransferase
MLKIGRLFRRGRDASAYTDPEAFDSEGVTGAVNGAFMLIREDVVREVGGFDEDFWMYGEDLDLCLRTTQAGWDVYYWPGVDVLHVKGGSSGKARTPRVNFAFHHAMWIFYKKHYLHRYGPATTAAVGAGIATKFALSLVRSAVLRSLGRAFPKTSQEKS